MVDISIKQGEGISQAIKRTLKEEDANLNIKGSVWAQVQQLFANEEDGQKSKIEHNGKTSTINEF